MSPRLQDSVILRAIAGHTYSDGEPHHEHLDCIRIAYEWLDAQKSTSTCEPYCGVRVKAAVEAWAGRYVSASDVELAAVMHPRFFGTFPHLNLTHGRGDSVYPSRSRLIGIGEADKHPDYRKADRPRAYRSCEGQWPS